ncbi:carbohydrate ABC transporter substrate-binding protein [Thalassomonas viridans]|uniref:Carbohydrate ABC transporter substrate-binding protein n=1 Tax=Thalassomonas viridans TaxID=137584 RepID=A0AAF0CCJ9_9GAMM|nr:ABC transporter substrate-binding protein [Thalassomonas viridans]WDE08503.1 carbohydrate ABC transporter substrate-binding protein [Thalassomonas viridans]
MLISAVYAGEIKVSVLLTPKQRAAYHEVFHIFSQKTGIKVRMVAKSDTDYKHILPIWLLGGKDTPDVLHWQASQRLFFYAEKDVIRPLTRLWHEENMDRHFAHTKSSVTYNKEVYAVPVSYYHWGLLYKKSLIKKYGGVPKDWQAFIALCEKMKNAGITPIAIGTKNSWPAAAWFDYLNLRINGLEFHQQLLNGKISFYHPRVQEVLIEWKRLIDKKFFNQGSQRFTWDEILPGLYREWFGFILIGNFVTNKLPQQLIQDFSFMPFPQIANIPLYEKAPTEVFMIAKNTRKIKEAEAFIKFISQPEIQSMLNKALGYLPPHNAATIGQNDFIQFGAKLLKQAKGLAQYFDRETLPAFEKKAIPLLAEFIITGNIEQTTYKLEQARASIFLNNTINND